MCFSLRSILPAEAFHSVLGSRRRARKSVSPHGRSDPTACVPSSAHSTRRATAPAVWANWSLVTARGRPLTPPRMQSLSGWPRGVRPVHDWSRRKNAGGCARRELLRPTATPRSAGNGIKSIDEEVAERWGSRSPSRPGSLELDDDEVSTAASRGAPPCGSYFQHCETDPDPFHLSDRDALDAWTTTNGAAPGRDGLASSQRGCQPQTVPLPRPAGAAGSPSGYSPSGYSPSGYSLGSESGSAGPSLRSSRAGSPLATAASRSTPAGAAAAPGPAESLSRARALAASTKGSLASGGPMGGAKLDLLVSDVSGSAAVPSFRAQPSL